MPDRRGGPPGQDLEQRWAVIQTKMQGSAHILRQRGVLMPKRAERGRRVWVLRFQSRDGTRTHRSIYVGCEPSLVRRARNALGELQAPRDHLREATAAAGWMAAAAVLARRFVRLFPRSAGLALGGPARG
jgi:hypothetical protein